MTKLRYTPPLDLEIEGTREDLAEVEARIRALADAGAGVIEILADSSGSPTPYENWLERLVITVGAGPLVSSVDRNCCLNITGSATNLETLASYFGFLPGIPDGHHTHLEYHPGDKWIAAKSVPIVVSVRVPCR
jgi:hypothetical protein